MVVVVFVSLLFMSASIPADLVYVEDILGVEDIGIGIVFSAWTLGMLIGANVVGRRAAARRSGGGGDGRGDDPGPRQVPRAVLARLRVHGR